MNNDNYKLSLTNAPSVRSLVLNAFRDCDVFDPDYNEYTSKIVEDVNKILKKNNVYTYVESKVKNVNQNIRAALQSIDGYQYIDSTGAERWIIKDFVYNEDPLKRNHLYFFFKGIQDNKDDSESVTSLNTANTSARSMILKILCDQTIFPVEHVDYSRDIINLVKDKLEETGNYEEVINSMKSIDNSIRQALETIDGYEYSNNTTLSPCRIMKKLKYMIVTTQTITGFVTRLSNLIFFYI